MSFNELQAVTILFDNSASSLNGDFLPTRFDAEKSTVETLARAYLRGNRESVVGFGTMADIDFGINTSLTKEARKIRQNLENVKRGGKVELEKAIKCGIYSLRHRPKEITNRRLIVILGSVHNVTNEKAEELAAFANKEGVNVDIVVFGDDPINIEPLKLFIDRLGEKSEFFKVDKGVTVLSDTVQQFFISRRPTTTEPQGQQPAPEDQEDDLQRAIRLSRQEAGIAGDEDPELQEALRLSMMDLDNQGTPNQTAQSVQTANQERDGVEPEQIDDPDLLEAMRLSMETFDEENKPVENKNEENDDKKTEEDKAKQNDEIQGLLDDPEEMEKLYKEFGISNEDESKKDGDNKQ
ncbi:26S proteasome non-ATPase regulatory subunit 4 [Histomonas meleagridis]|uniref:26S proteasome non-ATPase regulatory subunit 4 n=1 Tax=Histomonas meleagridis TaxID=135588 RepID=UPI003559BEE9|nr:26S proteasome non-ATPase regulatory subunit 4 [Histomonas meleagridis]KAH0801255.1 26S proteasome non-ATPase regulatory subunit 4 [Histomonas meleagridis]